MTEPAAEGGSEPRDFVKYTLLHLNPEWRRRPAGTPAGQGDT